MFVRIFSSDPPFSWQDMQALVAGATPTVTSLPAACSLSSMTVLRATDAVRVPQRSLRSTEYAFLFAALHQYTIDW